MIRHLAALAILSICSSSLALADDPPKPAEKISKIDLLELENIELKIQKVDVQRNELIRPLVTRRAVIYSTYSIIAGGPDKYDPTDGTIIRSANVPVAPSAAAPASRNASKGKPLPKLAAPPPSPKPPAKKK